METLLSLIRQAPATFWGVVAGSFLTLLGIWRTNLATDRMLRIQLDADRVAKRIEREQTMRKEIFLEAVEAVSAGISC